ncbi:MAG: hypothetical protein H7Z38_13925, partial [Rubrivivax sp.]|nr:hypothetical protein [Pyrinomonadaceae bacterium]
MALFAAVLGGAHEPRTLRAGGERDDSEKSAPPRRDVHNTESATFDKTGFNLTATTAALSVPTPIPSVRLNTADISNFIQIGNQPAQPGPTSVLLGDTDVGDVNGLYANDAGAAPGTNLDLFVEFQVMAFSVNGVDAGFRVIINDGVTRSAVVACLDINGQKVIALAAPGPANDIATYPLSVAHDWARPTTLKLRRWANGDAEILAINGVAPNPRLLLASQLVAGRTRAGASAEFGCLSVEGNCSAVVGQFYTEQPALTTLGPLDSYVFAAGGGSSSGGGLSLEGTLGETSAAVTQSGGAFTLDGGFWNAPEAPSPTPTPTPSPTPTPTPTPSPTPIPTPTPTPT